MKDEEAKGFDFPIEVGEWLQRNPEAKMWAYCLTLAIATAVGSCRDGDINNTHSLTRRRMFRDRDRFWLFRDERHYVGSCSWICELLGIDRERLIRHIIRNRHTLRRTPYRLRVVYNDR